jgi:SRSO17 transposase
LVSLTLARGEVPVMVGLRLFLPETWTGDEARLERAGVPAEYRSPRTKSEIALAELDRLIAAGVRFGTVLADAGYGMGADFRRALSARGLAWAVGIPRHQKVYPRGVELVFPVAGRGRPRKRHVPNVLSIAAEDMLGAAKWRTLAWRKGTKGPLKARFAAVRVRVADGPPQRIGDKGMQHMPGEEVCSSASGAPPESRNTISRTCRRKPASRRWPQRSRRAGSASRLTSNSRKNSASTTSKAARGEACIATH